MAFRKRISKKKTFKRKSYARKGKKMPAVRRLVRREIARNVENKTATLLLQSRDLVSSNNLGFNTQNVCDVGVSSTAVSISQGTGQGNRIGNRIKIKKLTFKGTIIPLPFGPNNTLPCPVQGKMWIFYDKQAPTTQPTPQNDFFQQGNSSNAFQNDLVDMWLPVNTDKYRVLATKTFKLGFSQFGDTNPNSYPNYQGAGYNSNNDFSLNINYSFDLTKHYPKTVVFRDSNQDPTTRGIYCLMCFARADGTAYVATTTLANHQYVVNCVYEDA